MLRSYWKFIIVMSVDTLNLRLNYHGGRQDGRMYEDKLRGLRKALLYSYQAATAVLEDGKEFRCLINPDKLKPDYDNKILSIPFEDICLNEERVGTTTEGRVPAGSRPNSEYGLKPGDVFQWKENGSYWLIYLRNLEEVAYFRAEIRKCESIALINGHEYKVYIRGPVETTIKWLQKNKTSWNKLNYSLMMFITKNEETLKYLHRHRKIRIDGRIWEVEAVDDYNADGVIQVELNEYYENKFEDETISQSQEKEEEIIEKIQEPENPEEEIFVSGPAVVEGLSTNIYSIKNAPVGKWRVEHRDVVLETLNNGDVKVKVLVYKNFTFNLDYCVNNEVVYSVPIKVK